MKKKNDRPTFWSTVYQETRDLIILPFIDYFRCGKIWLDMRTWLVNFVADDDNWFYFLCLCLGLLLGPWAVFMLALDTVIPVAANMCVSSVLAMLFMLLVLRYMFFKADQYKEDQMQELRNIAYTKLEEDELPAEVEEKLEEMLREKNE